MAGPQLDTERELLQIIKALRDNPEKYASFRRALFEAGTDEKARVRTVLHYATSEQELASLVPAAAGGGQAEAIPTTVTITTVFIACSAY